MSDENVVPMDDGVEEFCAGYTYGYNEALEDVKRFVHKNGIFKGVVTGDMFQAFREYQREKESQN